MKTPRLVTGASSVLAEFGGDWPSFHDAEVLRFTLERADAVEGRVVAMLLVHVRRFEERDMGTVDYHQALVKSVLIDFRFTGVENVTVSEFNQQNVIDDIAFSTEEHGAPISVEIPGIYGFDAQWQCRTVEVVSVTRGPGEADTQRLGA